MNRFAARMNRFFLVLLLTLGIGLTAACDTAEERAENHYQDGLALLEEGDVERALVEFRNVFKLNTKHEGARAAYARVQRERGFMQESYGQYLRLVEQYPDNLEGRRALAEMALELRDWDEVERHVTKASELAPDDLKVQSVSNTLNYFFALRDKDEKAQEASIIKAQALVQEDGSLGSSRKIVIDDLLRKQDWYAALEQIDGGLAVDPDNLEMYRIRLGVMQQIGDLDGIETQLIDLLERFPENKDAFKQTLVQFYISQNKIDEAEAFLRDEATAPEATSEEKIFLIGFLEQMRGPEQTLEQVNTFIAEGDADSDLYRSIRAKLNFGLGNKAEAIAEMEEILKDAERTEQTRAIEIDLARMLFLEDNAVGARALVEQVLSEDPSQPDAIKFKANWLIDDDQTGDAIVMLRDALSNTPGDADLMTLMARAHEREGSNDLKVEMLGLAVQASGNAPAESLRYASVLVQDNKLLAAEGVLMDALRQQPQNRALLFQLGAVYVAMEDWGRAEGVITALESQNNPESSARATELTARKLAGQKRDEDLKAMLENMANDPSSGRNVQIALLQSKLQDEGPDAAMEYLDGLLAEAPSDPALRFVKAGLVAANGQFDVAEADFRALVAEDNQRAPVWLALYRLKLQQGDQAAASAVLTDAIAAMPEEGNLLWARAGELERSGDLQGAIGIYEQMYARNSNSLIVANNLASLLTVASDDPETLQRAYTIARRLRESEIPAFQDTYGWIAFRRGDLEEALQYLEPAAAGLTGDPRVQFHLATTYAALGRNADALAQFRKVSEMIDTSNPPEFAAEVQSEITRLETAPVQD